MTPFLYSGYTVLVNLSERDVQNGRVYCLRYHDELRIKRVFKKINGDLILRSDNPDYLPKDEDVPAHLIGDQVAIIGRVRDKSGSGGL